MQGNNETSPRELHALNHPLRFQMVELFTRNTRRPVTAKAFYADLSKNPEYRDVPLALFKYHVGVLQRAELLPEE